MKMLWNLLPFYLCAMAGMVLLAGWGAWLVIRGRDRLKPPQEDDLLRPPGHTLAEKLAANSEKVNTPMLVVFLGSGLAGASLWAFAICVHFLWTNEEVQKLVAEKGWGAVWEGKGFTETMITLVLLLLGGMGFILWGRHRFRECLREKHRLRMGLRGEQAVAEELQEAVRAGYHLFHDLPGDKGNIDHVAVGPGGVFAIETKARSKRLNEGVKTNYRVEFDGQQLRYSDGRVETAPVRQAEAIASDLAKTLSRSTGRPVTVLGVIALPGWFVESNQFPKVIARNPRYLASELASAPRVLSEPEITSIRHQLDQACRDVSFEEE